VNSVYADYKAYILYYTVFTHKFQPKMSAILSSAKKLKVLP